MEDPTQRLQNLQRHFPAMDDAPLVGALRVKGGRVDAARHHLTQLGAVVAPVEPTETQITELADMCGAHPLPQKMARMALCRHNCVIHEAQEWLMDRAGVEACFEAATMATEEGRSNSAVVPRLTTPATVTELGLTHGIYPAQTEEEYHDESKTCVGDLNAIWSKNAPFIEFRGHRMVRATASAPTLRCVMCCAIVPGPHSGAWNCQACQLCEGCVRSSAGAAPVRCPAALNGGHVHVHPMEFAHRPDLDRYCDVGGEGCVRTQIQRHGDIVTWSCAICDFDVCASCIARPPPCGYRRRLGKVADPNPTVDTSGNENGTARQRRHVQQQLRRTRPPVPAAPPYQEFDPVAAQREVAALWQKEARQSTQSIHAIVGTGSISRTNPSVTDRHSRRMDRLRQNPADGQVGGSESRCTPSTAVTILCDEAKRALVKFRAGVKGDDSLGSGEQQTHSAATAADITLVEGFLHQAHAIDDKSIRQNVHRAIAAGDVRIAGTLLLSRSYAPSALFGEMESTMCWCGEEIDSATAPDGAVGCLRGHPMHPSCAADLLLGGTVACPTCRDPLFLAPVEDSEARSAAEFMAGETEKGKDAAAGGGYHP